MFRELTEEEMKLIEGSGYSKKAIELYVNAVNVGMVDHPTLVTSYRGPCGDLIELSLRIGPQDLIEDAKFYYVGCPGSASSASALTLILKNKSVSQAKKFTEKDILEELEGLPDSKLDCPKLCIETLKKALAQFDKIKGRSEL